MKPNTQDNQSSKTSEPSGSGSIFLILAVASVVLMVGIVAIQISEYLYYRAHPSAWSASASGGPVPKMKAAKKSKPKKEFKLESLLSGIEEEVSAIATAASSEAEGILPDAADALEESEISSSPAVTESSDLSAEVITPTLPELTEPKIPTPMVSSPTDSETGSPSVDKDSTGPDADSATANPWQADEEIPEQ